MIDFTNAIEEFNNYQGSEKKKTLIYNNIKYLVKFPDPIMEKNKNISYINNAFSEYIGSNIFKMAEFEAQNTLLGKYYYKGKEKFWDMFVIDSLIGNTDRHNGNWGFLLNKQINEINYFIDGIECISDIRKKFYKEIISYRYNNLKNIYEKLKS